VANRKLKSFITSLLGISIDSESFAGISVILRNQAWQSSFGNWKQTVLLPVMTTKKYLPMWNTILLI